MNKNDRKELKKAIELIEEARDIIENIKNLECEKFENLSEGLQESERGQKLEHNYNELDELVNDLEDFPNRINELIEN